MPRRATLKQVLSFRSRPAAHPLPVGCAAHQGSLVASKLIAAALEGLCIWSHRDRIVRWINCWYAALVVWNRCIIFTV